MREGETSNKRKFIIAEMADIDAEWESVPGKPFGALVIVPDARPDKLVFAKLAKRLMKTGCGWATLHAGKNTGRLHDIFDRAIVDYQLDDDPETEMMTSGETEDSLEEAMRDAVWHGFPHYEDPFEGLFIVVFGMEDSKTAEEAEALAKSVELE